MVLEDHQAEIPLEFLQFSRKCPNLNIGTFLTQKCGVADVKVCLFLFSLSRSFLTLYMNPDLTDPVILVLVLHLFCLFIVS